MLHKIFDDNEDVFIFHWETEWLGAVLIPCTHAIQCLEAKDTNPSDIYTYWLAIIAHLHDIMVKDDALKKKAKYSWALKEKIHVIPNFRFSQLIEDDQTSNIYLTGFFLNPAMAFSIEIRHKLYFFLKHSENHAAPILENPNPLAIPSITISWEKGKKLTIKTKAETIHGNGLSLLKLLQRLYGNEEEAQKAIEEINSQIAQWNPHDAISALKKQFKAYLAGIKPFMWRQGWKESQWEYWCSYLMQEDSNRLAFCATLKSAAPLG